jgi:hypothetical protein
VLPFKQLLNQGILYDPPLSFTRIFYVLPSLFQLKFVIQPFGDRAYLLFHDEFTMIFTFSTIAPFKVARLRISPATSINFLHFKNEATKHHLS